MKMCVTIQDPELLSLRCVKNRKPGSRPPSQRNLKNDSPGNTCDHWFDAHVDCWMFPFPLCRLRRSLPSVRRSLRCTCWRSLWSPNWRWWLLQPNWFQREPGRSKQRPSRLWWIPNLQHTLPNHSIRSNGSTANLLGAICIVDHGIC